MDYSLLIELIYKKITGRKQERLKYYAMSVEKQKKIVIIGSGFAGLRLTKNLLNTDYQILLIDKHNYHEFQPLMYQLATARLEPGNIAFPLRKEFQKAKNIEIRIADVESVNLSGKFINTTIGDIYYDYLVIACGCTTNYYGKQQVENYALPMKSIPDALELRNRILQTFEKALVSKPEELEGLMNFVVVGGGPTGVELSGALAEMKKYVLPKDYPNMDFSKLSIHLIEGHSSTLTTMSKISQQKSKKYLEELGVKLMLKTTVNDYDGKTITLKNGERIVSKNMIWVAGVTGIQLKGIPDELVEKGHRLKVNTLFELQSNPDVFVIGDLAYMETKKYPKGHPQLASVAVSEADQLSRNLKKILINKKPESFEYKDKGTMATVGKGKAVVDLPKFHFQGRFAWFTWMFVHLMLILGVKNKLNIFINWMMNYFTNDSTLRLILEKKQKSSFHSINN